jgi:hypothetical protein
MAVEPNLLAVWTTRTQARQGAVEAWRQSDGINAVKRHLAGKPTHDFRPAAD